MPDSLDDIEDLSFSEEKSLSITRSTENVVKEIQEKDWEDERAHFSTRMFYLLAMAQICLSFHGIFACPLATLKYGGVVFFIPYTIFTVTLGYPIHFLECSLGQYSQLGPIRVWNCVPLARGIGFACSFSCIIIAFYNNIYATYAVFYFARCFDAVLPWADCDSPFYRNKSCIPRMGTLDSAHYRSAQHYFYDHVLQLDYQENEGHSKIIWQQALTLLYSWFLIYLSLFQSIRSLERILPYFVAIPLFCLIMLLSASIQIHGSLCSLKVFFGVSNLYRLGHLSTWYVAAQLVLVELAIAQGTLITYGSYSHHRNKINLDSRRIICVNYSVSLGSSLIVWFLVGSLYSEKSESESSPAQFEDFGYVFILFTETLGTIPGARIWSICICVLVFVSCLNSGIAIMHTITCALYDYFPQLQRLRHVLSLALCFFFACSGVILCRTNSWNSLQSLYEIPNCLSRIPIASSAVAAIILIYGMNKYCEDIYFLINYYPPSILRFSFYCAPFVMLCLYVANWYLFSPFSRGSSVIFKLLLCSILLSMVIGCVYWMLLSAKNRNFKECWRSLDTWGPGNNEKARVARTYFSSDSKVSLSTPWSTTG